jgi:hypothetical protein
MNASVLSASLRLALIVSLAGLCGACGMMDAFTPSEAKPRGVAPLQQNRDAPESEKIVRLPLSAADLHCPIVDVPDEGSTLRVGGPENASVRYQFDIKQTARECQPLGDQFSLKVGVSGELLIGPAGSPGAYSAPVRLTVTSQADKKTVYSKVYKIDVNTGSAAQAPFQLVSETIELPMTRTELDDDYAISIAFDTGKAAPSAPSHKHKSAKSADAH